MHDAQESRCVLGDDSAGTITRIRYTAMRAALNDLRQLSSVAIKRD